MMKNMKKDTTIIKIPTLTEKREITMVEVVIRK